MPAKLNCWEFMKCGREPGGKKTTELGVCPAAMSNPKADGVNDGKNGGRICWALVGTFCGDKIQGEFAEKQVTCLNCDFFQKVKEEEGAKFYLLVPGQIYRPPKR